MNLKIFVLFLALVCSLFGKTSYVTQAGGAVVQDGTTLATAWPASFVNNPANWGAGGTKISPGDKVILSGTFTSQIIFQASGTSSSARTVFIGNGLLTQTATPSWTGTTILPGISFGTGLSHLAVYGVEITQTGTPAYPAFALSGSSDIVIEGNYIHDTYNSAVFDSQASPSSNVTVQRNWMDDIGGTGGGSSSSTSAEGVVAAFGNLWLIQYNTVTLSMDRTRIFGEQTIVRNNYWGLTDPSYYPNANGGAEHIDGLQGFDISTLSTQTRVVYERNYDTDNGTSSDKNGHSVIIQMNNGYYRLTGFVTRFNVLIRPSGAGETFAGVDSAYLYNNTSINIGPTYTPGQEYAVFFQAPACDKPNLINNTWDYSLNINASSGIIGIVGGGTPTNTAYRYSHAYNPSGTQPLLPSGTNNLAQTTPGFTDGTGTAPHDDYTLTSGALLRNAGGPLTTASGSGTNSTALTVVDSLGLCDGFGIAEGDTIVIGNAAAVKITSVNRTTHAVTLAEQRTWADGDQVRVVGMTDLGGLPYGAAAPAIASGSVTNLNGAATVTVSNAFNVRFVELLVDGLPVATQYTPSGNVYSLTWAGDGSNSHTFTAIAYSAWAFKTVTVNQAITYSSGTTKMRSGRFPNKAITVTIP